MEELVFFAGDGDGDGDGDGVGLRCAKHPSAPPTAGGVCPGCLRDRLLRLCPDCGRGRPCACGYPSTSSAAATTTTTTSSSSSSLSSVPSADLRCGSVGAHVGAVGRVSHLIDSEPSFHRSRSAAFRLLRPRSDDTSSSRERATAPHAAGGKGGWSWLWPFQRGKKPGDEVYASNAASATLSKSRSVGALLGTRPEPDAVRGGAASARPKGWNRYLPRPMKALRQQKAPKAAEAKYPLAEVSESTIDDVKR